MLAKDAMHIYLPVAAILAVCLCIFLVWRWASRHWQLPCPALFAWALESHCYGRLSGTSKTLDRLKLLPSQRILEIGPGPGRLLIPAALRVQPGGEAVGIDIQPGMVERLRRRADESRISNLTAILGDATEQHVQEASFDLVFLAMTLGEIPNRTAALAESYKALKPGGTLSVTEMFADPHYQRLSTIQQIAEKVGFRFVSVEGGWWFFTARFMKG